MTRRKTETIQRVYNDAGDLVSETSVVTVIETPDVEAPQGIGLYL